MGGQAFARGALVLDMRPFNQMTLDESRQVLTVGSGATWHDIQTHLHPKFAVKAMQSTDIFTVGGSISVNAHGMDHHAGSVGRTIRSMRVMLADGSIRNVSRTEDPRAVLARRGRLRPVRRSSWTWISRSPRTSSISRRGASSTTGSSRTSSPMRSQMNATLRAALRAPLDRPAIVSEGDAALHLQEVPAARRDDRAARRGQPDRLRRLVFNLSRQGPTRDAAQVVRGETPRAAARVVHRQPEPGARRGRGVHRLAQRADARLGAVPAERRCPITPTSCTSTSSRRHELRPLHRRAAPASLLPRSANLLNASVRIVHREDMAL